MKDPLVVRTDELAQVVEVWVAKHRGRFLPHSGGNRPGFNYGAKAELAIEAYSPYRYILDNLPETHRTMNERTIYRILSRESKHTHLSNADAILSAIEETGALSDGRIEVIHNPAVKVIDP